MQRSLKIPLKTSQDLSLGSLSYSTSFNRRWKLDEILVHFSVPVTETITITFLSKDGSSYYTVLQAVDLIAEQNYVYRPQGKCDFYEGDELKVQCTNANLTGTVFATIKSSEVLI